jgi:opacity protein-like surface antigen
LGIAGQTNNFIKGFRMKKLIFALIAAATAVGSAQAAGPYVGVGIASADHSYNLSGTTNGDTDGYKASGKIFGGYDIDQTWGVEAGYTDFRKSTFNYTDSTSNTAGRAESDGHSFYIAGKATAPINEQVSVFGKLGAAQNKSTLSSATTPAFNRSDSKTEVYAGVGVQYNLNQKVALTAEYERYGKSKDFGAKADVLTVAAKYAF